jgi:Zn-dependent protease with chaperone function
MDIRPGQLGDSADASRGDVRRFDWLKDVLLFATIGLVGYFAIGWLSTLIAQYIPDSWERKAAFKLEGAAGFEDSLLDDKSKRARAVFAKITTLKGHRKLRYELVFYDHDVVNAFAAPGGTVALTRGLLSEIKKEVALAMVLGHEMGHHFHRHVLTRLSRTVFMSIAKTLLFSGAEPPLFDGALSLAELSFSRKQELDADSYGFHIIRRLYENLDGFTEFFEYAAKGGHSRKKSIGPVNSLFLTHPYPEDRIKKLLALERRYRR